MRKKEQYYPTYSSSWWVRLYLGAVGSEGKRNQSICSSTGGGVALVVGWDFQLLLWMKKMGRERKR